jgi:hypothetical protein
MAIATMATMAIIMIMTITTTTITENSAGRVQNFSRGGSFFRAIFLTVLQRHQ